MPLSTILVVAGSWITILLLTIWRVRKWRDEDGGES